MSLEAQLTAGAKDLNIELSSSQTENFLKYLDGLLIWNEKFNLTSITKKEEIITKHFLDSLTLVKAFSFSDQNLIDIGTGAGFPALPLKIIFPDLKITLLDSSKKKIEFLNHIVALLELNDVITLGERAEDAAKKLRETFDLAVSRAVAPLRELSEYCLPFIKVGGLFIAMKSEKIEEELDEAENAIKLLGGKLKETVNIKLPGTEIKRSLVIIEKVITTPSKYPRRAGMPKKNPL